MILQTCSMYQATLWYSALSHVKYIEEKTYIVLCIYSVRIMFLILNGLV